MIEEKKNIQNLTTDNLLGTVKRAHKNGVTSLIIMILGLMLSVASVFVSCFVAIGFDFSQIKTTTFWLRWVTILCSTLSAFVFVLLHCDDVNKHKPEYADKMQEITEKSKQINNNSFEDFLYEFNTLRAIAWYKHSIGEKISALHIKILHIKTKAAHKSDKGKRKAEQKVDVLESKIKLYEAQVAPEFIAENKHYLKTKSKPISRAAVLSEAANTEGEEIITKASAFYGKKGVSKIFFSLLASVCIACILPDYTTGAITWASALSLIMTLLSIAFNCVNAIITANDALKNVHVKNAIFKLKIINDFEAWNKQEEQNKTDK